MLAILTTHPIQYQVPLWQALAKDGSVPFEVWYLTDHGTRQSYDRQFDKSFAWDLDVLSGYPHRFLNVNRGAEPSGFNKVRITQHLTGLFQARKVDALWVQGWQVRAYWQAVWQARAAGVPVWLRGESNDLSVSPMWKKPLKQFLLKEFFRRVQKFLYIGQANRRLYARYGVQPRQLHPAPYCVDNERFAQQADLLRRERIGIRRAWNIPDDAFCVLFAGKFISKKRAFDLIAGIRDPRLRGRRMHLLFAGSGEMGDQLRHSCQVVFDAESSAKCRNNGSPGLNADTPRASFVGFLNQTEISKAYVAADCLVLPSGHGETWGLVANEAMASGLPCIVSDACGCGEDLVAPVNPKFRFPLGDTGAMAEALLEIMTNSYPASVLQRQVEKFSITATVETVQRLYQPLKQNL